MGVLKSFGLFPNTFLKNICKKKRGKQSQTIERKNNEIFLPKQQIHLEKKVPNMMKTMKAMVVILK